ncbi:MAG TPA: helix-turn-helix domain-containing protein [Planktothrix sp.]|jgi:putative transcriptional regulator
MPAIKKRNTKVTGSSKVTRRSEAKRASSSILAAVHNAASDLHALGIMNKATMREFDALCLPKIPNYTPAQIRKIRSKCNASQQVFAKIMNTTSSSLQKWESGAKKPNGTALKLLNLADTKGLEALI